MYEVHTPLKRACLPIPTLSQTPCLLNTHLY